MVNESDACKPERAHSISISMPPSPVASIGDHIHDNPNSVFYSQPMSKGGRNHPRIDRRFDSFKTWSGQLERQLSNLRGIHPHKHSEFENMPVDRYFAALEGPELDTLRVYTYMHVLLQILICTLVSSVLILYIFSYV